MLRAQLRGADDVLGRIHAGQVLAKSGEHANIEAIADAYVEEPFWGLRVEWAKALSQASTQTAVEALEARCQ